MEDVRGVRLWAIEQWGDALVDPGSGAVRGAVVDDGARFATVEALVRLKLLADRTVDRAHIDELAELGLIDATWPARFAPKLAARLRDILDMSRR